MNYKILLPFFMVFCALGISLNAQGLLQCPPGEPGGQRCTQSCINCSLDSIFDQNPPLPPGLPPLTVCGGAITLESPRYYGFVAGSPSLTLEVTEINCLNGQGLEFAFVEECGKYFGCMPGPNVPLGGKYFITVFNLVVGQPYQFMVDGFNGENCQYLITVNNGSTEGPPLGAVGNIEGLAEICPNATATYTIPEVENAIYYQWTSPPGSFINGTSSNSVLLPASAGNNSIDVTFGQVGGQVCVKVSNACDPPVTKCFPITFASLPPTILPDLVICNENAPYEWEEEPHNLLVAPGTYNLTSTPYLSYLGCDSLVKQKVVVLPYNQTNLPLQYLCNDECFVIGGFEYCETGTYQEYLYTDLGCDSLVNFSLYKIISHAEIVTPDTITCAVTSVPLSGAGSSSGNTVSYKWLDPNGVDIGHSINATANSPGQYALIVTNQIGGHICRDTAYVEVPANLVKPMADAGPDMLLTCNITEVQLQGNGSMGANYTYFWKVLLGGNIVSGVNTLTPLVNAPGTYSLRVTDTHNGCTAVSNTDVDQDITPPVVSTAGGTVTCSQPNVTLQASTTAPNPSYVWSGPNNFMSSQQNPSVSVPGTYTVLVTNGNTGCTSTSNAEVIAGNAPPNASATGGAITCAQLDVTLMGNSTTPGVSYSWTGPGGFMSMMQNPTVSVSGNYQLKVTGPNGCTSTVAAMVTLNNTPPGTTLSTSGNLNCNNNSVNVLASSMGNPANLTHQWTLPDLSNQNTGVVAFLSASVPGLYSVLVTNTATGCQSTASFTVVEYADVTASVDSMSNARCFESNDGVLSVLPGGGDGVYTYAWSNGGSSNLVNNLAPGLYTATVTDGDNCTATVSATVTAPAAIVTNATATPQMLNGAADGTATANPTGGTPGYTYAWSNGEMTQTITGLLPGSYTVTVTDINGCTKVKTVNVSQFDCTLAVDLNSSDITCFGEGNGTAFLNFSGGTSPYMVMWSTGETTDTISNLAVGSYSVSVTDAANCPDVQTFTIDQPTQLIASPNGSVTSGPGTADGTASANASGGTMPYNYAWSNGETTAMIMDLLPGIYTVSVMDANGCQDVKEVEVIAGNCSLTTDFQTTNPVCVGDSNGVATILLTGGAGGFSYAWSSGGTDATETGLPAGTHTVSVTDVNNCSIEVSVDLIDPPAITVTLDSVTLTNCATAPEGEAFISIAGGTGDLSVEWSDGQTGTEAIGLIADTYTATVTDESGCVATLDVDIMAEDTEAPVIAASDTSVPIGPNGSVILTTVNLGATVADNCVLSSVSIVPNEFTCLQLGEHEVVITAMDDAGNTTTDTITVTAIDNSNPSLVCSPSLVLCFEDNPVSYQAPTATDNCLINGGFFNITEGLPIGATFPVGTTTTTYTFTDSEGNMGSCSFEVTILPQISIMVDTIINDFNFQNIGAIFINVSGGLPPYTYSWMFNGVQISTNQNISGLGAGIYTLDVIDDNGCTIATQIFIVDNTSATHTPIALDEIRIFPNPTAGNLTVMLPAELVDESVFMQVYDQTGRRVMQQNSSKLKHIDLSMHNLADGLYSVVIRVGNQQIARKIILDK
ncbi:MAG: T9SS type A sorting domain-containing protein [Saprospiraceae bacterium]